MNEEQIRQIVRDEIQKNYTSGTPKVAPHSHTRTDNLQISQSDLKEFIPLTPVSNTNGVIKQLAGQPITGNGNLQIPIIYGYGVGVHSAFNGGTEQDGQMIIFTNGSTVQLWLRANDQWKGISLTLTA